MGELSVLSAVLGESCQTDFDTQGGFVLWAALVLYTFYVLAGLCDGHLTGVLEKIVEKLRIPEDVAGATFLAMSSSAPELFCSIVSTFAFSPSIRTTAGVFSTRALRLSTFSGRVAEKSKF